MSLDAINQIRGAEDSADQTRAEARGRAQQLLSDAERAGKELLNSRLAQAKAQAAKAMDQAEREAQTRTQAIQDQARAEADALRAQAETHMAQATKLIIEKVVER